jgi:hypothetical protein
MIPDDTHPLIGSLMFEGMDQIDLTGPFEALSRVPNSTYQIYAKTGAPVRDLNGLRLIPGAALAAAPRLDVLHVPGGFGQEALMEDQEVLAWYFCRPMSGWRKARGYWQFCQDNRLYIVLHVEQSVLSAHRRRARRTCIDSANLDRRHLLAGMVPRR